mgnify:CR=1 FL=1
MVKQFDCQMCDATLTGASTDEVVEKIKQHGKQAHGIEEMSAEDLEKRKNMIKEV